MKFNPEEFLEEMKELKAEYPRSVEEFHKQADQLMCDLLTELGYKEGVDFYLAQTRWFS